MSASSKEISEWFDEAKNRGCTHLIIMCDTYDHEDYPVYVMPGTPVEEEVKRRDYENTQRALEVYATHLDRDTQLNENRSCHLEYPMGSII